MKTSKGFVLLIVQLFGSAPTTYHVTYVYNSKRDMVKSQLNKKGKRTKTFFKKLSKNYMHNVSQAEKLNQKIGLFFKL